MFAAAMCVYCASTTGSKVCLYAVGRVGGKGYLELLQVGGVHEIRQSLSYQLLLRQAQDLGHSHTATWQVAGDSGNDRSAHTQFVYRPK